jgi:hypothetical protein
MYKKALTYPSVGPAIKDISQEVEDFTRFFKLNGNVVFSASNHDFDIRNFLFADPVYKGKKAGNAFNFRLSWVDSFAFSLPQIQLIYSDLKLFTGSIRAAATAW